MGKFVAEQTVKELIHAGHPVKDAPVVVLGLTFKEDCPDLRNSRVIDIVRELRSFGCQVHVHDPVGDPGEALHEYGVTLEPWEQLPRAVALVAAVAHRQYRAMDAGALANRLVDGGVFVDVKASADAAALRARGVRVWRL
jgi:UDP-N-acetyl-D-galactosamine dehydrogenase